MAISFVWMANFYNKKSIRLIYKFILKSIITRKIFNTYKDIPIEEWNRVLMDKNIYLHLDYLSVLEDTMSDVNAYYYVISYNDKGEPKLISAYQLVNFKDQRDINGNQIKCLISNVKSKMYSFDLLVCGNVFSNGENGFEIADDINELEASNELSDIVKLLQKRIKKNSLKVKISLFKEFWAEENTYGPLFKLNSFREFMIDVNMILPMNENWGGIEDYLKSLKAKYRTRAKSVYKKSNSLVFKNLNSTEINHYSKKIESLYKAVVDKSSFTIGRLKPETFAGFKARFGDQFLFRGVFLDGELVAFSTGFCNHHVLEANYIGLDYSLNHDLSIYQRLLYDYIEQAIEKESTELHLGRTSELIKSAIGAIPKEMKLYAKHNNRLVNSMLKHVFRFVSPSKFELRQPFKTEKTN